MCRPGAGCRNRARDRPSRRRDRARRRSEQDATSTGVAFWKNASIGGGPAPVRAYIEELLPDVLEGRIEPGRVFDRTGSIEDVPDGYRAMNEREVLKFE